MKSDQLRQLADAATPGPWEYAPDAKSVWGAAGNVVVGLHHDAAMRDVGVAKAWVASTGLVAVDRTRADARLIAALGPDAARLFSRMADVLASIAAGNRMVELGDMTATDITREVAAQLVNEFDALGEGTL